MLIESLLLSGIGALLGLAIAYSGSRMLVRELSTTTNTVFLDLSLDWRMLAFTAAVAVSTALVFGSAPALRSMRVQPNDALKSHSRVAGEGPFGPGHTLVVLQVALSLVLLVGAGLFIRTFSSLAGQGLGFDDRRILVATVDIPGGRVEPSRRLALFKRLQEAAASVPGVSSVAFSNVTPFGNNNWVNAIELRDGPRLPLTERLANFNLVSAGWFQTYGTRLLAGRDFSSADTPAAPPVAIVNETFARRFTGGKNPIGIRVRHPWDIEREIVGYVSDAVYTSLREPAPPTLYIPYEQAANVSSAVSISVRAATTTPHCWQSLSQRRSARCIGDLVITIRPMADRVDAALIQERIVASLSAFFGALALLLAGLGLFGIASYSVTRRRAEIGIRVALGAAPAGVVALLMRRVLILIGTGVAVGTGVSLWSSQFIAPLLYGLQPRDP